MQPDPVRLADTRAWLVKAANDLRAAAVDLAATPPLLEDALFHCQQAAEKAFEAFLTFHDQPFRRTHNLEELGAACLACDASLQSIVDEAVPLSEYAWAYRYPGPAALPTLAEADAALATARRVYQAVCDQLPAAARP